MLFILAFAVVGIFGANLMMLTMESHITCPLMGQSASLCQNFLGHINVIIPLLSAVIFVTVFFLNNDFVSAVQNFYTKKEKHFSSSTIEILRV